MLTMALIFAGCKKTNDYPIEPVITFKSLTVVKNAQGYDHHVVLVFSFTDGDGDLGLNAGDTVAPYRGEYSNVVHVLFYGDTTGSFTHWSTFDDLGRIPVITPEGNQKGIRGDIQKDPIYLPANMSNLPVRFEVYIYDRALHKSNVITTPAVVVNTGPP
jgi:hypothetical protein